MKKLSFPVLIVILFFLLYGCSKSNNSNNENILRLPIGTIVLLVLFVYLRKQLIK
jgi:ABC-type Zn uptake system ZnuABC Zn-binding protein ZnuA